MRLTRAWLNWKKNTARLEEFPIVFPFDYFRQATPSLGKCFQSKHVAEGAPF